MKIFHSVVGFLLLGTAVGLAGICGAAGSLVAPPAWASTLTEIAELLAHPEQYDRQEVTVTGKVTNVQIATNRQGQLAYGFLLQDPAGTVKVISLGKPDVREGDLVIVHGIFSRLRQVGRAIVYNEIKALSVQPLNKFDPDLVG
ncbi:hypothetical protein [Candidatus Nitrospira inopinata]|jgi:hypothetical protein|uniref:Uncharacterized protein n=1 Tax=Candidatus Nitrospira inopinata TaxID=1715989 RepID=A0A0S4KYL4_9BACT|nr:hypothetical protein [Candidatus Nitrospira inopinata]CUQ67492.1 conserved exported protein of unknown function [Candidatus Nitrospira inopinata]